MKYNIRLTDKISNKLTVYETYLYYCLALCTDFNTMESNVKQETLAKFYYEKEDISNIYIDEVRKYLHILESNRFIAIEKSKIKGKFGIFEKCKYKLSNEHFFMVSNQLYNEPIKKELKGFLILLKSICLNSTNLISYTLDELSKKLKYSRRQISTYLSELKKLGYLKAEKKGISIIREDLFPLLGSKIDNYRNAIESIINQPKVKLSKRYKEYLYAKENDFKDIRDLESFFLYILCGNICSKDNNKKDNIQIIMN